MTDSNPVGLLYDRKGIPIERGDVLKVFHFVGARRRRHYMYYQSLGLRPIGKNASPYYAFSHLNFIDDHLDRNGPYLERPDGRSLNDYEIVQSIKCDHEERAKKSSDGELDGEKK